MKILAIWVFQINSPDALRQYCVSLVAQIFLIMPVFAAPQVLAQYLQRFNFSKRIGQYSGLAIWIYRHLRKW